MFTVVSFHTPQYAHEAARLERSLKRCGVEYRCDTVPDKGDWHRNTAYKPEWLRTVRRQLTGTLLWVDADAVLHSVPQISESGYDIAMRNNHGEWMTGTIVIRDTLGATWFLNAWCDLNTQKQRSGQWVGGGQANAGQLIEHGGRWCVHELPAEMCWVGVGIDQKREGEPVIEHLQASREFHWHKKQPGSYHRQLRDERIAELEKAMC